MLIIITIIIIIMIIIIIIITIITIIIIIMIMMIIITTITITITITIIIIATIATIITVRCCHETAVFYRLNLLVDGLRHPCLVGLHDPPRGGPRAAGICHWSAGGSKHRPAARPGRHVGECEGRSRAGVAKALHQEVRSVKKRTFLWGASHG